MVTINIDKESNIEITKEKVIINKDEEIILDDNKIKITNVVFIQNKGNQSFNMNEEETDDLEFGLEVRGYDGYVFDEPEEIYLVAPLNSSYKMYVKNEV